MGKPKVFKFSDPNQWHFCSNFSTLNCSTLNVTISHIKKINVRINFDLFTGMGNIFGHLESNKRVFGQNFQDVFGHNFDKVSEDDHLVFSISAFSKVEIRPFELLRFEQNSKKFIHGESGLKTYVLVLVMAALFMLCALGHFAEKNPKIEQKSESNEIKIKVIQNSTTTEGQKRF